MSSGYVINNQVVFDKWINDKPTIYKFQFFYLKPSLKFFTINKKKMFYYIF